jgi:peptidoglycan/LPS O-acetylase OafA/YrhL
MSLPAIEGPHQRIASLDAVRGVAALSVVVGHGFVVLGHYGLNPASEALYVLLGRLPVTIFFALSGFVLALPFFDERRAPPSTLGFIVKRILRIYVPYLFVMLVAIAVFGGASRGAVNGMLLMTGTPIGVSIDPPSWSLVVEMRYSLLFPLLVLAVARAPWLTSSLAVAIAVAAASTMHWASPEPLRPTDGYTFLSSFVVTAYYAPLFCGGILLARYRRNVVPYVRRHANLLWTLAAALTVAGYWYDLIMDAVPLLVVALVPETGVTVRILSLRFCVWLGRISYSLYLLHGVVLLAIWHFTGNGLVAVALFIPISLVAAALSYRIAEVPSIQVGWKIARALDVRAYNAIATASRADS